MAWRPQSQAPASPRRREAPFSELECRICTLRTRRCLPPTHHLFPHVHSLTHTLAAAHAYTSSVSPTLQLPREDGWNSPTPLSRLTQPSSRTTLPVQALAYNSSHGDHFQLRQTLASNDDSLATAPARNTSLSGILSVIE
jgi:hypothetical protein